MGTAAAAVLLCACRARKTSCMGQACEIKSLLFVLHETWPLRKAGRMQSCRCRAAISVLSCLAPFCSERHHCLDETPDSLHSQRRSAVKDCNGGVCTDSKSLACNQQGAILGAAF